MEDQVNNGGMTAYSVLGLAIDHNGYVYAGGDNAAFRSTDNGVSWVEMINGLPSPFRSIRTIIAASNGALFVGAGVGVFRSTDAGTTWVEMNTGLSYPWVYSITFNLNGEVFAGTGGGLIFRSTNEGENWVQLNTGFSYRDVEAIVVNSTGHLFAATSAGIRRSTNNGTTWFSSNDSIEVRALGMGTNDYIFAGTYGRGIYRSTDNGDSWSQVCGAYQDVRSFSVNNAGHIFAGTFGDGVYRSTDEGSNWDQINDGLLARVVYRLAISPSGGLFATTSAGIFRTIQSTVSIEETNETVPMGFDLSQNFPNPFNPSTTIRFALPKRGHVELKIYNTLGQEVATLVNEEKNAGTYLTQWNAGSVASGVYFCRLQSGEFTQTRKLLLLK